MIKFYKANRNLSFYLLMSILFFLRKGIQYSMIGSFTPLLIILCLIALLIVSVKKGKSFFKITFRIWAIILIFWALIRLLISTVHLTVQPFDGSFHLAQQFGVNSLILSIIMLILGILVFRSSSRKRLKDWL